LNISETRYIKELPEWQASLRTRGQPFSSTDCMKFSDEYEKRIRGANNQDGNSKGFETSQTLELEEKLKYSNVRFKSAKKDFQKWLEDECKSKSRKRKEAPIPTRREVLDAKANALFAFIHQGLLPWGRWNEEP
jgi:hypothetical protein